MKPLIFAGYSIHLANPIASERFESALERSELACERSESAFERPEMDGWTGQDIQIPPICYRTLSLPKRPPSALK